MPLCYIALGSNLGNRYENLQRALDEIQSTEGVTLRRCSYFYETKAVGMAEGTPDFYNGAVEIETNIEPMELLRELQRIERSLGRVRDEKIRYSSRTLDLDLLLYGDLVLDEPDLQLPHPRMAERWFVLRPLMDLCPEKEIPGRNETVEEAFRELKQQ